MTQRTDPGRVEAWACLTISTIHAASGGQYAGLYAWLWLALALAFVLQPSCIRWLRRRQSRGLPVGLRLLMIRMGLRRATLGDAFGRLMQRRKGGPR